MKLLRENGIMAKKLRKKIVLPLLLVLFTSLFLVTPISMGYGTEYGISFVTAVTRPGGTTDEEVYAGNFSVFYKIYCLQYANVSVDIGFNSALYNLSLYVYNNTAYPTDYSNSTGVDYQNCSITCNLTGFYYIEVNTTNNSNWQFELNITMVGGSAFPLIPGFEIIYILVGLALTIGFLVLFRRKENSNSVMLQNLPN